MNNTQHKILIITAPSGAGKTSITMHLMHQFSQLAFSVSAATRKPRANEKDGVDYHFMTEEDFKEHIQHNDFVEWEMVYEGKYYGTLKSELQKIWDQHKIPVLDIDVKGAIKIQKQLEENCLSIFIMPPSIEILKQRLENRKTETAENIQMRLDKAAFEISFSNQFNVIIQNNDLTTACTETKKVIYNFLNK